MLEKTGVGVLAIRSAQGQAIIPDHVLREWAAYRPGSTMTCQYTTDPVARALRAALVRRIREFPAVRCAWVSRVRWETNGDEHLMVHLAVDEPSPRPSADALMRVVLGEEVTLGEDHPKVGMIALHTAENADSVADLDRMGLDTVRHDPATGRVEVVSREYDEPPAAPVPTSSDRTDAPPARPKGRWFGRS